MDRLKNKVCIITGADGGICHAASQLFCQEGAKVVMVDKAETVKAKAEAIKKQGGDVIAIVGDVSIKKTWDEILKTTLATYGTVDCCINGAAEYSLTGDWNTNTIDMKEWDLVFETNLKSMLYSYQVILKYMLDNKIKGNFINFTSATALSYNGSQCEAYPMSKAAIKICTNDMAACNGKYGIRFNMVAPNSIKVPKLDYVFDKYGDWLKSITPLGHLGDPVDAAWVLVFLASDEAKFVSGAMITIDGGWSTCH